jgi:hypothetical protein
MVCFSPRRSVGTVDVGSVLNPDDVDELLFLRHAINDPICATPCREVPRQLASQRFAHPMRVLAERAAAELPYGKGNCER